VNNLCIIVPNEWEKCEKGVVELPNKEDVF